MDLPKWIKKMGKKEKSTEETPPSPGEPGAPFRLRPRAAMPRLPKWAKKDAFIPKRGQESPPPPDSDMADMASIKRPGEWLKKKLGVGKVEALQRLEKTKETKPPPAPDEDLKGFLDDLLEKKKE